MAESSMRKHYDTLIQIEINLIKRWAVVFQVYSNTIHFNLLFFSFANPCHFFSFSVFVLNSAMYSFKYGHFLELYNNIIVPF